jgi:hypothetical protein
MNSHRQESDNLRQGGADSRWLREAGGNSSEPAGHAPALARSIVAYTTEIPNANFAGGKLAEILSGKHKRRKGIARGNQPHGRVQAILGGPAEILCGA